MLCVLIVLVTMGAAVEDEFPSKVAQIELYPIQHTQQDALVSAALSKRADYLGASLNNRPNVTRRRRRGTTRRRRRSQLKNKRLKEQARKALEKSLAACKSSQGHATSSSHKSGHTVTWHKASTSNVVFDLKLN